MVWPGRISVTILHVTGGVGLVVASARRCARQGRSGRTGLVLVLGCAQVEHNNVGRIEIVDHHVEMHLLGCLLGRPGRATVVLDLLE